MCPAMANAQANPVQRIANMVSVGVSEYTKAVDVTGRLVSGEEYKEAVDFLTEARQAAVRLPSERTAAIALLDSIIGGVNANRVPADVAALERRFAAALGSEGALAMPTGRLMPDAGRTIYQANCAACHGVSGRGDGPCRDISRRRPRP